MKAVVTANQIGGRLRIPESKSYAHRLLICAALSGCPVKVCCKNSSQDIDATARCLSALLGEVKRTEDGFAVRGGEPLENGTLLCGESGSTYRFLLPVACALGGTFTFVLEGKLPERPMEPLMENLEAHGITVTGKGQKNVTVSGNLTGGKFRIPGDVSSQFVSGLLFALPLLSEDSTLEVVGGLQSKDYVAMTLSVLRSFGICIEESENGFRIPGRQRYRVPEALAVEGDWSNAAFWLALGAIGQKPVTCTGLHSRSVQGDRRIAEILEAFGAQVEITEEAVTVSPGKLRGISLDAGDIPDLVPIISLVGAVSEGKTEIFNAARLRWKESDRLQSVAETIRTLGGRIQETKDGLVIEGVEKLKGGTVSSFNDHRIAMTAAVAAAVSEAPVTITDASAVRKSYPGFYEDYKALGGEVWEEEEIK